MQQSQSIWDFIDQHPQLDEDRLLDELEKHFSREEVDDFTAAMTGLIVKTSEIADETTTNPEK